MIFISFNLENCRTLRKLLPKSDIQWFLAEEITDKINGILNEYRLNLDSDYQVITKDVVDKIRVLGLTVNCWTCNTKEVADRMIECGVDYITTNILE